MENIFLAENKSTPSSLLLISIPNVELNRNLIPHGSKYIFLNDFYFSPVLNP